MINHRHRYEHQLTPVNNTTPPTLLQDGNKKSGKTAAFFAPIIIW